jgi:hypothetical protein
MGNGSRDGETREGGIRKGKLGRGRVWLMLIVLGLCVGRLSVGDWVNCERAMAGHSRFGGHMVQVGGSRVADKSPADGLVC